MKNIYQEEGGFQKIETNFGSLTTVIADDEFSHEMLSDQISMTIDFNDTFIEKLEDILRTKYAKVGLLVKIEVEDEYKGRGKGTALMKDFKDSVSDKTDVDILFARIRNKQNAGFNLQDFYKSHGFDPVFVSEDSLLMINKNQGQKILEEILPHKVINADDQGYSL